MDQLFARRAVNCSINAASSKKRGVRRVNDGIEGHFDDVAFHHLDIG